MKHLILKFMLLVCAALLIHSCKKQNNEPFLVEDKLTDCKGSLCNYSFTEHTDVDSLQLKLKPGSYRLFQYIGKLGPGTTTLFVKAPMEGNSFTLNKQAVLNGRVFLHKGCATCLMVPFKIIDGFTKGINLTPNKPADQSKWLIEAKIFTETLSQPSLKDTLYIKQYFYPNFVYN